MILTGAIMLIIRGLCKTVVLPNLCIFVNLKSSFMANKLRFQIHSGFELEQNSWFFKALS